MSKTEQTAVVGACISGYGQERFRIAIFRARPRGPLDAIQLLFIYRWPSAHDLALANQITIGALMKRSDLEILSTEELWVLHEKVAATLKAKIIAGQKVLDGRLSQLNGQFRVEQTGETPERRAYPTVFPKFRNPEQPSETWTGRGKKPRWLTAQLESGKQIDDFRIDLATM
jgi:DNA-binding protein H-NS